MRTRPSTASVLGLLLSLAATCTPARRASTRPTVTLTPQTCTVSSAAAAPDSLASVACADDFDALASEPLSASLPGARSVKVVYDRADDTLYFQNSARFRVHFDFVSTHLSGGTRPVVGPLSQFNTSEYFSPDRRFILGAVTHYEGADVWALEFAPYDTASASFMQTLFNAVQSHAYFGPALVLHPTSDAVQSRANELPATVPVYRTDDLYGDIEYQPLTLGVAIGRLRFRESRSLEGDPPSYEDIVVLDEVPNDISVVRGLITEAFQTPLSHVNVLSQNRGTPNMGLRNARTSASLRALEGRLVELSVTARAWAVREVTQPEAEAFWAAHAPAAVTLPALDLGARDLVDAATATPEPTGTQTLREVLRTAVRTVGGKCAHYSLLARTPGVPVRAAFCVPVYFYDQFIRTNGLYDRFDAMAAEERFRTDAVYRQSRLRELHSAIMTGAVDPTLQALLRAKLRAEYPLGKIRFRTSTNSEDLDGFPCAGCYESHTGDPRSWGTVLDAIRETYASAWSFRTVEERRYYGIDHHTVGMALLVHYAFPEEEANGVAVTANPFDDAGLDPALYVNVQRGGDVEVVAPPPGTTSDQLLYYFSQPGQPATYLAHSSLVGANETVLTPAQLYELGRALTAIHQRFSAAYGPGAGNTGFYAMDVEFKFDDEGQGGAPHLLIKQARPYPGRGR